MAWTDALAQAAQRADPFSGFRYPLLSLGVAFLATLILTPLVKRLAEAKGAIDDPTRDDRRIHTRPIPRWGGLAVYGGVVAAVAIVLPLAYPFRPVPAYLWALLLCGGAIVALGSLDDVRPMPAKWQALYLLLAGVAVQFLFDPAGRVQIQGTNWPIVGGPKEWLAFGAFAVPLTAVYVFVVTKTMDTIDGVDGLASGIAGIAAGTLSVIATYEGQPRVALVTAAVAGAAMGFLRYNYNPAQIFLATGGSQFFGFMLAGLSIVGAFKTAAALMVFVPVLVFGVPIIDAAVVTVRRMLSGQPITQADKRHIHHELLKKGLSQRQTVWVLYLVALALCGALVTIVRLYG